jgi:hypothetical protein
MSNTYLIEIRIARLSYPDEIPLASAAPYCVGPLWRTISRAP